jgi:hypothetical protein
LDEGVRVINTLCEKIITLDIVSGDHFWNPEMGNMTPTPSNVGEGAKLCFLPVKFENFPNFPVITKYHIVG